MVRDIEEATDSALYYVKRLKDAAAMCPACKPVMDRFGIIEKALSEIYNKMLEEDEADEGAGGLRKEKTEGR